LGAAGSSSGVPNLGIVNLLMKISEVRLHNEICDLLDQ